MPIVEVRRGNECPEVFRLLPADLNWWQLLYSRYIVLILYSWSDWQYIFCHRRRIKKPETLRLFSRRLAPAPALHSSLAVRPESKLKFLNKCELSKVRWGNLVTIVWGSIWLSWLDERLNYPPQEKERNSAVFCQCNLISEGPFFENVTFSVWQRYPISQSTPNDFTFQTYQWCCQMGFLIPASVITSNSCKWELLSVRIKVIPLALTKVLDEIWKRVTLIAFWKSAIL